MPRRDVRGLDKKGSDPFSSGIRALALVAAAACGGPRATAATDEQRCILPAPTELFREGTAILLRWDLPDDGPWLTEQLPDDAGYRAYRAAIRDAGAELARPIHDEPTATTEGEREMWRREARNAELAAPYVRPIRCLEAALFAYQHARYDQLVQPTELVSVIVRNDQTLRVYFGASDQMFPPKRVYGIDEARRDVAAGWRYVAHLHNHTIQQHAGKHALGTPAPSGPDVHLLRGIDGLARVWVTNGVFTADIPSGELARFEAR